MGVKPASWHYTAFAAADLSDGVSVNVRALPQTPKPVLSDSEPPGIMCAPLLFSPRDAPPLPACWQHNESKLPPPLNPQTLERVKGRRLRESCARPYFSSRPPPSFRMAHFESMLHRPQTPKGSKDRRLRVSVNNLNVRALPFLLAPLQDDALREQAAPLRPRRGGGGGVRREVRIN